MAKLSDIAPEVIVNCATGETTIVELSPAKKQARLDEIIEAEKKETKKAEKDAKKAAALEELKKDKKNEGLLIALGLIDPPE